MILEVIKKDPKVQVLLLLIIIGIIFYLSPLFEMNYKTKCFYFPETTVSSAGADVSPLCDLHIYGKTYEKPSFPYREKSNERIEFCKKNIKNVEKACGLEVDEVILEDHTNSFNQFFICDYIKTYDNDRIKKIIDITKFSSNSTSIKTDIPEYTYINSYNSVLRITSLYFNHKKECKDIGKLIEN